MDDQPTPPSEKSRWRLLTYETERAKKWGRGALIATVLGALAMLGGTGAGALFVLGGIGAHLAARRIDRGLAPVPPLGELTQWRPRTTKDQVGLGLAALLAVGGIASLGEDPAPSSTAPQGIADQELVAATEEPVATDAPEPTDTPRPTRPPATATDEPEPTATLEPPTAVPPTEIPPPTAAPVVEPSAPPPPPEPQPAARTRGGPQGSACPADLPVKGNQGSNGWIYHDFSSPNYDRTEPEECFATAADAEAAGYRAPRR